MRTVGRPYLLAVAFGAAGAADTAAEGGGCAAETATGGVGAAVGIGGGDRGAPHAVTSAAGGDESTVLASDGEVIGENAIFHDSAAVSRARPVMTK